MGVGYDCFDWGPFLMYIKTKVMQKPHPGAVDPSKANEPVVTHGAFVFIVLTAILNSQFALHIVVGGSVAVYYVVDRFIMRIPDLETYNETDIKENGVSPDVEAATDGVGSHAFLPNRKTSNVEREL